MRLLVPSEQDQSTRSWEMGQEEQGSSLCKARWIAVTGISGRSVTVDGQGFKDDVGYCLEKNFEAGEEYE